MSTIIQQLKIPEKFKCESYLVFRFITGKKRQAQPKIFLQINVFFFDNMFKKWHWLVINNNILFALPFRNLLFVYLSALASILPSEFRPMINAEVLTRVHAPKTFVKEKCTLHIDYVPFLAEVKIKKHKAAPKELLKGNLSSAKMEF